MDVYLEYITPRGKWKKKQCKDVETASKLGKKLCRKKGYTLFQNRCIITVVKNMDGTYSVIYRTLWGDYMEFGDNTKIKGVKK